MSFPQSHFRIISWSSTVLPLSIYAFHSVISGIPIASLFLGIFIISKICLLLQTLFHANCRSLSTMDCTSLPVHTSPMHIPIFSYNLSVLNCCNIASFNIMPFLSVPELSHSSEIKTRPANSFWDNTGSRKSPATVPKSSFTFFLVCFMSSSALSFAYW